MQLDYMFVYNYNKLILGNENNYKTFKVINFTSLVSPKS